MANVYKVKDLMDNTFTTFKPETPMIEAIDTMVKKG